MRSALDDAIKPLLREEAISKLVHVGSTQGNESLNGVIGSKNPKIRHYGGSESADFGTAAGVAQFNDGHAYITEVCEVLDVAPSSVSNQYVENIDKKTRKRQKPKICQSFQEQTKSVKKGKE